MTTLIKRNWNDYKTVHIMCKQLDEKYEARIYIDENADHPRSNDANLSCLYAWHRSYGQVISDSNEFATPEDFLEYAEEDGGNIFELYMYDHSGIVLSLAPFSDPWDSGQVGFAYIPNTAKGDESLNYEQLKNCLREELSELTQYINGYVYSVSIHLIEDISNRPIGADERFSARYTNIYNENFSDSVFDEPLKELLHDLNMEFDVDKTQWLLTF